MSQWTDATPHEKWDDELQDDVMCEFDGEIELEPVERDYGFGDVRETGEYVGWCPTCGFEFRVDDRD